MSNRLNVLKTYKLYTGGKFSRSESEHYFQVMDKKGNPFANLCRASRKDMRNAVAAARKAQSGWADRSAYNRGQILYRMAEIMEGRRDQFVAELERTAVSRRKAETETDAAIDRLVHYAGWTDKYSSIFSTVNPVASPHFNFSMPEPNGVVGIAAPDDMPLIGLVSIVAPVIAGGNTCVVLASETHGSIACTLAEIIHSSDVPGGVVNILTGYRKEIIPHLASHMDVNAFLFAADDPGQKKIVQENAHLNVKRIQCYEKTDWLKDNAQSPYYILDFQDIKTTWHPVGT
ncbi:aldehyde dehydrogenase family protein [Natronogracilivirga saccharolytica]|uniref:Aldehyde dehydrogenase family protein n=1 Tax=Natronogracilivirga saccharolytica TaxID=2812953 RepID=A0A8J7RKR4_9BACT|nr:aldehyde dehydrogenase family protein [Natronogracilivirga saccharolytica]MBP3193072.1 aldehyde dehydrogenase family protein [Natronogracilivirga saccharolytica]